MSEITLNIPIDPQLLSQIQNLPGQILTLASTARGNLARVLDGTDAANPVAGLFTTLSSAAEAAGELPTLGDLIGQIQSLAGQLPSSGLVDAAQVATAVEGAMTLFGPLREALLRDGFERGFQEALRKAQAGTASLVLENEQVLQINNELQEFFRLFRMLTTWGDRPPGADDVVELLSRALIGVPPNLLERPALALENALAPLSSLVPPEADLTLWREAPAQQLAFWQQIDASVGTPGSIDWPALEVALQGARRTLLDLTATRDRLLSVTISNLNRLDLGDLSDVSTQLAAIPVVVPTQMAPIFNGLRRQLQGMLAELEEFTPTPEEMRAIAGQLVGDVFESINESPLGKLRLLMIEFQQRLIRAIEDLPFRNLALEAEAALRKVADSIDIVDPDAVRQPIGAFFAQIRDRIGTISTEAVKNAVGQIWVSVENALNQVMQEVERLRTALEGATDSLGDFVASTQPTLQTIQAQVKAITDILDSFDLSQPAEAVIEELNRLRDTVSEIDVSSLPAIAVEGIKQGAEALRQINITAALSEPLNVLLEEIDPTPHLQQATQALRGVVEQIEAFDPASLAVSLDTPVNELLTSLQQFGPQRLAVLVQEAMEPIKAPLRQIDFATLLAPLTRLYAELNAKLDAILNPDLIFQPLEELYQPVIDLVDQLDPIRLVDLFEPHVGWLTQNLGSAASPPATVASQGSVLKDNLTSPVDTSNELFGFRPGDLLIPLIDLHHKLTQAFEGVSDSVLSSAAPLFQRHLHGRLSALEPGAIAQRIEGALEGVRSEFDLTSVSRRLSDAAVVYYGVVGKINAAASLNLSAGDRAISQRITLTLPDLDPLRLQPDTAQNQALAAATVNAEVSVGLQDMRNAFATVGPRLGALLPDFMKGAELTAATLRDALRSLDPAPIRDEINALFDSIGARLVALEPVLTAALEEIGRAIEEFLLPLNPGNLITLASRLHASAKSQILALGPATFKDEVKLIFDVVKGQLSIFDPSVLVGELNALRDDVLNSLDDLVQSLLPDLAPFNTLLERLATLKPSRILASLTAALKPLTDLVLSLNPLALVEPIIEAIARIREQLPQVIADIEAAFDDVLAAFPSGGIRSVSATVEVG